MNFVKAMEKAVSLGMLERLPWPGMEEWFYFFVLSAHDRAAIAAAKGA